MKKYVFIFFLLTILLATLLRSPSKTFSQFSDEDSPFGKHFINYWGFDPGKKEKIYQAYKDAGVKWIRWGGAPRGDPLVCWRRVQPQKNGPLDWEKHDQEISLLKSYGFLLMSNLGTGGDCTPDWLESLSETEKTNYLQQWLKEVVGRYGSKGNGAIKHWEMVPELSGEEAIKPNKFLADVKMKYQTIKAADPQAVAWISFEGAWAKDQIAIEKKEEGEQTWIGKVFAMKNENGKYIGAGQYTDILGFHKYGPTNQFVEVIKAMNWMINNSNYHLQGKQVWVTEGGPWGSWMPGEPPTEEEKVEIMRERYNIALGKTKIPGVTIKISKVFWTGSLIDKDTLELTPFFFAYQELATGKKTFILSSGWNKIAWPDISGYTAKTALEDIDNDCGAGTAMAIARKQKNWWKDFVKDFGGENFNLQNEQDYFINVTKDCNWNL